METPDKIYLEKSLSSPDKFHSQWYKEDVVGNGVEYIRKDLLFEWAKDNYLNLRNRSIADRIKASAFKEIIDKLNSL